jgi:hypothetical protein
MFKEIIAVSGACSRSSGRNRETSDDTQKEILS